MSINVLSLFDGISCGQVALERVGIKVNNYFASEIDKNAIKITMQNYPNTIQLGDVTKLDDNILLTLPKIDLLIGGSPCQQLSRAGNGKGLNGESSRLFWEYVRVLNWIKEHNNPNVKFLLENVHMKKTNENIISDELEVKPMDINSKLVSAQNRPRLYWTNIEVNEITDKAPNLIEILDDVKIETIMANGLHFDKRISEKAMNLVTNVNGEIRVKQATKLGYISANNGDGVNLAFPTSTTRRGRVIKSKSNTLDCSCEACVLIDNVIRYFTINELEKLQTLPIDYTHGVSDIERKKVIGNGWTVDVIAHIFKNLKW